MATDAVTSAQTDGEVDVEDAIDEVGFGCSHVLQYIIIGLFTAADSVEVGFLSYVTEELKEPWSLTATDSSLMESMVFVGQIIGAPCWGKSADRFGRRPVFLISATLITMCGIITAITQNKIQLIAVRFFVGVGVAGLSVPFDIFAEMLPSHLRAKMLLSTFFWFAIGSIYTTLAAYATLCTIGWRGFTLLCALPTFIATIAGIFFLPESAHWLASTHRTKDAAKVVNKIARANGSPCQYKALTVPPVLERLQTRHLCSKKGIRRPFFSMLATWFGFGVGFYGISLMLPHLFVKNKETASETRLLAETECHGADFDFGAIMKSNVGQILGLILSILFIDRWGRRPVQQISYGLSAVMCLGLGFPEIFGEKGIAAIAAVALAAQMAGSCSTWTHTPELFPTNVRGTANALCNSAARTGAALSTFIIGDLIPMLPTAIVLSAICIVSVVGVSFARETKDGHLDSISDISDSEVEDESDTDSSVG
eukprot:TRINITY_DN36065_c0_g2_i1.p1 TRINITY_DN36065_c0_g2~~TRINITY_DN36065_c0_g2_i1.p1  ORF type:complete len:507 (+),score=86.90 TRINITY_DN36065_c0_g2_i1:76-1521(+)